MAIDAYEQTDGMKKFIALFECASPVLKDQVHRAISAIFCAGVEWQRDHQAKN